MIAITDLAIFTKLEEILGFHGVFTPEDAAFRTAMEKYGDPLMPLYALYWNTTGRDTLRFNLPAASRGVSTAVRGSGLAQQKVKYTTVDVQYDLHIWRTDEIDIIDSLRTLYFFSTDPGANGVDINVDELGLRDIGVPLTMDLSASLDRSSVAEEGNYFHVTTSFIAHTYFVEGLDQRVIRKITVDLYTYVDNPEPDNDGILQNTFEVRSET